MFIHQNHTSVRVSFGNLKKVANLNESEKYGQDLRLPRAREKGPYVGEMVNSHQKGGGIAWRPLWHRVLKIWWVSLLRYFVHLSLSYPCCARFEILPIGRLPGAGCACAPPGGGICWESIDILTFRASNFKTCLSSSSTSPSFKRSSGDPRQQFFK